jgi:hypothetical protein
MAVKNGSFELRMNAEMTFLQSTGNSSVFEEIEGI